MDWLEVGFFFFFLLLLFYYSMFLAPAATGENLTGCGLICLLGESGARYSKQLMAVPAPK